MKRPGLAVLAFAGTLAHAAVPSDYAVILPITTSATSAAWRIELGPDVYAWSQDETLRDVAVFDADGRAVPIDAWVPTAAAPSGGREERLVPLALPAPAAGATTRDDLRLLVERDAEGRLRLGTAAAAPVDAATRSWLLDVAGFDEGVDRLHLDWSLPAEGVFARFAVDASDDLQTWRTVRGDAAIALLQQGDSRIERRMIPLDGQRTRYLRLRRLDEGPVLTSLAVRVEHVARSASPRDDLRWLPATAILSEESGKAFDYRLPARVPVEAVRLELAGDNSTAELTLSEKQGTRDVRPLMTRLLRFSAYRLRDGDAVLDQGDLTMPATRRLGELHLDSTRPLGTAPTLQVGWRPRSLVFLAEGRAPYVLAVGHASARREPTPLASPLAVLRARLGADWQPPQASLDAPRQAAGQAALVPVPPAGSWRRTLLWVILAAGAVLVVTIALALLRGQRNG